jgi:hypothetical protein
MMEQMSLLITLQTLVILLKALSVSEQQSTNIRGDDGTNVAPHYIQTVVTAMLYFYM